MSTKEYRSHKKFEERHRLIQRMATVDTIFKPPADYNPLNIRISDKVMIPQNEYPDIDFAGLLIGPYGNTIKSIQKETGTKITIFGQQLTKKGRDGQLLPSKNIPLHANVTGNNFEYVHKAVNRIKEIIKQRVEISKVNPIFKPPADYNPLNIHISDKVMIPQDEHPDINFAGLLIGPNGNTIKSMEKETGAKIRICGKQLIYKQPLLKETEPLHAYISGNNFEYVHKAVNKIKETIKQWVEISKVNPICITPADYSPPVIRFSDKVMIPQDEHPDINFVGLLIGPHGNTLKSIEKETGNKITIFGQQLTKKGRDGQLLPSKNIPLHANVTGNNFEYVHKAVNRIKEIIKQRAEISKVNPIFKPPADYNPLNIHISDKVMIPQDEHPDINFAGLLIGPNGNTIKSMEKETGAKIRICGKQLIYRQPLLKETEPLHAYISGNNFEYVHKAVNKIKETIKQWVEISKVNPICITPADNSPPVIRFSDKVMIPQDEHPDIKFVGLLIGPHGNTLKSIEKETGTKITIFGQQLTKKGRDGQLLPSKNIPLHANVTGNNFEYVHKAVNRIKEIIKQRVEISKVNPIFKPPADYNTPVIHISDKVMIPQDEHPDINFAGILIGPNGNTIKSMEKETGAKIRICGKQLIYRQPLLKETEPLHAYISGNNFEYVHKAVNKIKEIIKQWIEVSESQNDLKHMPLRELSLLNGTLRENNGPRCSNCGAADQKSWICQDKSNTINNMLLCTQCTGAGYIAKDCRMKYCTGCASFPVNQDKNKIDEEYMSLMAELGKGSPPPKHDDYSICHSINNRNKGLFDIPPPLELLMSIPPPEFKAANSLPPILQSNQPMNRATMPPPGINIPTPWKILLPSNEQYSNISPPTPATQHKKQQMPWAMPPPPSFPANQDKNKIDEEYMSLMAELGKGSPPPKHDDYSICHSINNRNKGLFDIPPPLELLMSIPPPEFKAANSLPPILQSNQPMNRATMPPPGINIPTPWKILLPSNEQYSNISPPTPATQHKKQQMPWAMPPPPSFPANQDKNKIDEEYMSLMAELGKGSPPPKHDDYSICHSINNRNKGLFDIPPPLELLMSIPPPEFKAANSLPPILQSNQPMNRATMPPPGINIPTPWKILLPSNEQYSNISPPTPATQHKKQQMPWAMPPPPSFPANQDKNKIDKEYMSLMAELGKGPPPPKHDDYSIRHSISNHNRGLFDTSQPLKLLMSIPTPDFKPANSLPPILRSNQPMNRAAMPPPGINIPTHWQILPPSDEQYSNIPPPTPATQHNIQQQMPREMPPPPFLF